MTLYVNHNFDLICGCFHNKVWLNKINKKYMFIKKSDRKWEISFIIFCVIKGALEKLIKKS